jgi:hypothetical protein
MVIHSDSQSAIARASHSGAGPRQSRATAILELVAHLGRSTEITRVKGHSPVESLATRADVLAGKAADKTSWSAVTSLAHLKLRISEKFRSAKEKWHGDPTHHETEEIPPPPPKKSCLDRAGNALARTAAQICTGHWRSAVYLKRIRKWADDCQGRARMTRSHVLLHCPNDKLGAARMEAWEGKDPGGVCVLLANPRWEKRLLKFLELSGVGRVMADRTDEDGARAAAMDEWIVWEAEERVAPGASI